MGSARIYLRVDHILAWCTSLLGLEETEISSAFFLRVQNYCTIGGCQRRGVHLRKFVRGLVPSIGSEPTVLSTDNKAARDLSYNPEHHRRSKHVARRHFFIRDMVESFELVVPFVPTKENPADNATEFVRFRRIIVNERD